MPVADSRGVELRAPDAPTLRSRLGRSTLGQAEGAVAAALEDAMMINESNKTTFSFFNK